MKVDSCRTAHISRGKIALRDEVDSGYIVTAQLASAGWIAPSPEDVRHGIPAELISAFVNLGLTRRDVLRVIGAPRQLRRRKLTREESDRLARLARVVEHAIELFGSTEKATRWLQQPILDRPDNNTPLDMLDTDPGAEWVDERLTRTAFGMVA